MGIRLTHSQNELSEYFSAAWEVITERALLWRRAWFCHTRTRARAGTVRSNCLFKKERTIEEHKKHAVWPLYLPERAVL